MPLVKRKPLPKKVAADSTKAFLVYVPESVVKKLDRYWTKNGFLSRSEFVRAILTQAMDDAK